MEFKSSLFSWNIEEIEDACIHASLRVPHECSTCTECSTCNKNSAYQVFDNCSLELGVQQLERLVYLCKGGCARSCVDSLDQAGNPSRGVAERRTYVVANPNPNDDDVDVTVGINPHPPKKKQTTIVEGFFRKVKR